MQAAVSFPGVGRSLDPSAICMHARLGQTRRRLIDALSRLEHDDYDAERIAILRQDLNDNSDECRFLDNAVIAHAAAELIRPSRALEIGVRRGFCAAALVAGAPRVEMHVMDAWPQIYAARPNPGSTLVRRQLQAVGHIGNAIYHHGNSHVMLPKLRSANRRLSYDLILVDGDHTERGAEQDLSDAFGLVGRGGVLIFDDLVHPQHRYLLKLWNAWRDKLESQFSFAEHVDCGLGVGWAVRD
ncbi:MAG: class I SAM-dependent methyltransferase [Tepidisphaeraceae bacterium]